MICPICGKRIRDKGSNRRKVCGEWIHKVCPGTKSYRRMKKEKKKNG
jgi:hypothetical protein